MLAFLVSVYLTWHLISLSPPETVNESRYRTTSPPQTLSSNNDS